MDPTDTGCIFDEQSEVWKPTNKVRFLEQDLEVWLSASGESEFASQMAILSYAQSILPQRESDAKEGLFKFYQEACEDFSDLVGTEMLPVLASKDELDQVFGLSVLIVPEQIPSLGATFRIQGGCSWSDHGVQLFFRDGTLQQVDSDCAMYL